MRLISRDLSQFASIIIHQLAAQLQQLRRKRSVTSQLPKGERRAKGRHGDLSILSQGACDCEATQQGCGVEHHQSVPTNLFGVVLDGNVSTRAQHPLLCAPATVAAAAADKTSVNLHASANYCTICGSWYASVSDLLTAQIYILMPKLPLTVEVDIWKKDRFFWNIPS
jgi:hypothetical protein